MKVVVVGAGIVGACCAVALAGEGHAVTLVEPEIPGGEHAASYGNGAWISPASVVPMSLPGLWKKVPGYLMDPGGPLTIRPMSLPRLAPWLMRFLAAGARVEQVESTARALSALLACAPNLHRELADAAGVHRLIEQKGLLYAYENRAAFETESLAWRLRRDNGVEWQELGEPELRKLVPMLSARYRFGAHVTAGAHCRSPGTYVGALVRHAQSVGADYRRGRVTGFAFEGDRLKSVILVDGSLEAERAVIAAGIDSAILARAAGDVVPLESERGYHVEIEAPGFELPVPVMPADGKMGNTSTDGGLRLSGQVELCSRGAAPDWRRADILLAHARAAYPGLASGFESMPQQRWMGHRPSTPDGLPVLGPARRSPHVFHAFGHGHVGLAAAPASARLIADLIAGRAPAIDPRPYRASRFA